MNSRLDDLFKKIWWNRKQIHELQSALICRVYWNFDVKCHLNMMSVGKNVSWIWCKYGSSNRMSCEFDHTMSMECQKGNWQQECGHQVIDTNQIKKFVVNNSIWTYNMTWPAISKLEYRYHWLWTKMSLKSDVNKEIQWTLNKMIFVKKVWWSRKQIHVLQSALICRVYWNFDVKCGQKLFLESDVNMEVQIIWIVNLIIQCQ